MENIPIRKTNHLLDYSIVLPVYYNEGLLRETFESIKRDVIDQDPSLSGEVIFVDDG
ncbi:MAG: hypothetical protein GTO02_04845, partial [Candidatus Dadabacteria bacterium]|nr:hypothetical protein [Candidatus Dadabacteria bacterium]